MHFVHERSYHKQHTIADGKLSSLGTCSSEEELTVIELLYFSLFSQLSTRDRVLPS